MIGWVASAAAVSAGGLAWGAFERNSPLFGRVQRRLATRESVVALTFDDGPNPNATPAILDALGAEDVRATFFVLGRHADRWPALVARAEQEAHVVGNHGYHHQKLIWRAPSYVRDDIALGAAAIERAGASRPRLFRAPHGQRSPWVTPIARAQGQRTVGWTLGVWDTSLPGPDVIANRVMLGVDAGAIVLLHDGDGYDPDGDRLQTARALPRIIRGLRERGFSFVALSPT
jgi:peptidoglycan/xylan/chitin deacetylase (PgdA/CDA1 family)